MVVSWTISLRCHSRGNTSDLLWIASSSNLQWLLRAKRVNLVKRATLLAISNPSIILSVMRLHGPSIILVVKASLQSSEGLFLLQLLERDLARTCMIISPRSISSMTLFRLVWRISISLLEYVWSIK